MALIKNNARVAAEISVELAKLQENNGDDNIPPPTSSFSSSSSSYLKSSNLPPLKEKTPVVIGGSILDIHYHVQEESLEVSRALFNYLLYIKKI